MNGQEGERSRRADDEQPDLLNREVAQRSIAKRRESVPEVGASLISAGAAIAGFIASLGQFLGHWRWLLVLIIIVIVAAVVALAVLAIFYLQRRRQQEPYTFSRQIRDENLRKLISVIAGSQKEFERAITSPDKNALRES